jgi:PAS domain S-box-containing protein
MPLGVLEWALDSAGDLVLTDFNEAADRQLALSSRQALGRRPEDVFPSQPDPALVEALRQVARGGGRYRNESFRHIERGVPRELDVQAFRTQPGRVAVTFRDVTDERRRERELRVSEAKFAAAFYGGVDYMGISRVADGTFLEVNAAFERITGYRREEVIGHSSLDLGLWPDPSQRAEAVQRVRRDGYLRDFPIVLRRKDGAVIDCQVTSYVIDIGGEEWAVSVVRDMTEAHEKERALAESEARFRRLIEVAPEAILVHVDGRYVYANPAAIALLGVTDPDQLLGKDALTIVHPDSRPLVRARIAAHVRSEPVPQRIEQRWLRIDGTPIDVEVSALPFELAGKRAVYVMAHDLTERKRAERALRESEQRFSAFFHASPIATVVSTIGESYRAVDVNDAWVRTFGYARETVLGRNGLELGLWSSPADRERVVGAIQQGGEVHDVEAWLRRADGRELLCLVSGRAIRIGERQLLILAMEDITEKKAIERELKELNLTLEARVRERTRALEHSNAELASALQTLEVAQAELVQSERLAALGALVAGVSHELNTPIGNSLMVASTLQDSTAGIASRLRDGLRRSELERFLEETRTAGEIMVRNLQRAAELIASFKQVAIDRTSAQRRRFLLHEVVDETLLTLMPTLRRTPYRVATDIPDDLVMDGFPGPLGQVLSNLVENALRHGFEGRDQGTIRIVARSVTHDEVELLVEDDGVGMSEDSLRRVFDPFFTTKLGLGGSGLGMNIVHNIVTAALGGRVGVTSAPGRGTRVTMRLPTTAPRQPHGSAVTGP